ncbi:response regulator [Flavobacterium tibetense]|uniref:Response regulatory domain-containing protein n=1 Tax=Flavobacterium tibetense TaxID=2233533 RepID=A0A365NZR0_9FLAO|nr:hypothetical protein [Flavobacterium tibetense]RBA27681.1 hypothetical protein DPN68_10825 [Flavobacterium tibetense]
MYTKEVLTITNEIDFLKIKKIGEENTVNINFHYANTEEAAITILKLFIETKNTNLPDLIIVDINFINKKNIDIIWFFEKNVTLKIIPLIILGEFNSYYKLSNSFKKYSNCWLPKPNDEKEFEKVIQSIFFFWFKIAKLPNKNYI